MWEFQHNNAEIKIDPESSSIIWKMKHLNRLIEFNSDFVLQSRMKNETKKRKFNWKLIDQLPETQMNLAGLNGKQSGINLIDENSNLNLRLEIFIPDNGISIFCRYELENSGEAVQELGELSQKYVQPASHVEIEHLSFTKKDAGFYANGWQSWSFSAAFSSEDIQPYSNLQFIPNASAENPSTIRKRKKGIFSSDFYGVLVDKKKKFGVLVGFLSQLEQFGSIHADLRKEYPEVDTRISFDDVLLSPGGTIQTDWQIIQIIDLNHMQPLDGFVEMVRNYHSISDLKETPVGWCSWYHFFTNVSEQNVIDNLEAIKETNQRLPMELVQLDDGFQSEGGDWFSFNQRFPNGVENMRKEISKQGFTPGIWLAPFIASKNADLVKQHPKLLLRTKRGKPVFSGVISNKYSYALDISNPQTKKYIADIFKKYHNEWGFPYLKLDFLYAGILLGDRFDKTKTRAKILRETLQMIRDIVGKETFLLGCGVPIGSSIGIFDAVRIGADVDGFWEPKIFGIPRVFRNNPQLPAARNATQNILTRAHLHKKWWINDPDCLLIRPTELNMDELKSLATLISMSGGSLILSDDLTALPADRFRIAQTLYPILTGRPIVIDLFDQMRPEKMRMDMNNGFESWHILAVFNWANTSKDKKVSLEEFHVDKGIYWLRSFWDNSIESIDTIKKPIVKQINSNGVQVFAVKKKEESEIQYLGGDLHISQGCEIQECEYTKTELRIVVNSGKMLAGTMDFFIPDEKPQILVDGQKTEPENLGEKCWRISTPEVSSFEIRIKKPA